VQELKAKVHQIDGSPFARRRYYRFVHDAERPGYSGVALYTREQPLRTVHGLGIEEFDREGRYIEAEFERFAVVSVYLPSGTSGDERQAVKYRFLDAFEAHLAEIRRRRKPYILCGDFNIAHRKIDIKNWRGNQKNSGFLPEERAWMETLLTQGGYVDAFRVVNQEPDQYTWWSNRGRAREKNVGWRIDYQIVSKSLTGAVQRAAIYKSKFFSDHAPLTIDYEL
jgi:exodeoxyribonuclease-3